MFLFPAIPLLVTEFAPLVNARAHQLGRSRRIMNKAVEQQYRRLLEVLCYKPADALTPSDYMAVTYHLLLQVREWKDVRFCVVRGGAVCVWFCDGGRHMCMSL